MIPKTYRLILQRKTPFIGQKKSGKWATIITRPNPSPRWAIRINKHVIPLATGRNRIRRQLNQWLYRERGQLIPQDFLIILKVKPKTISDNDAIFVELTRQLFKS